jgi:prepilin-type N-terminal cleavage/methylation domain-containing protein
MNESEATTLMQMMSFFNNAKGFTLIELIAVMVILGVMASVGVKKFNFISDTASDRALGEVIKELNVRETVSWTKIKWANTGWTNDADLFAAMDTHLGTSYVWTEGPNAAGGTIKFKSRSIVLTRTPSTTSSIGRWKKI